MAQEEERREDYALSVGRRIGRWCVARPLGRGGMAEVYEVVDAELGSRYALKLFTYAREQIEMARVRFFAEGKLLARLDHPRLVRVYDLAEDAETGRPYFVMDLVLDASGKPCTLAEIEDGVDEDQVAAWYEDLRDGLAYIHGQGVLHRDLKLQNVLVGADGHAVLSDFGVASIFNPELRANLGISAEQTLIALKDGRKSVMGSMGYMAPEIEMGVAASVKSDWYALGVIVFRLLTGVWYDVHMDLLGDLETYNPVWREVLPKLLHPNPAGRECLSWMEREKSRREEMEYNAEKAYTEVRGKLRRAKKAKKWLIGILATGLTLLSLALALAAVWQYFFYLPPFEELCAPPADAKSETDDDSPTKGDYELAQIDAWVLTHGLLADVRRCEKTRQLAAESVRNLAHHVQTDDDIAFAGSGEYESVCDNTAALSHLLLMMADRMDGKTVE